LSTMSFTMSLAGMTAVVAAPGSPDGLSIDQDVLSRIVQADTECRWLACNGGCSSFHRAGTVVGFFVTDTVVDTQLHYLLCLRWW